MRSTWRNLIGLSLPVLTLSLIVWATNPVSAEPPRPAEGKDIVDTAMSNPDFSTLTKLLKAANLVETLKKGDYTVFAPTNAAFEKLGAAKLEELQKPENEARLRSILTYHVVSGKVNAEKVMTMKTAKTVNGAELHIKTKDGAVMINDAKVTKTDISASNGFIHVIDAVVMPPEKKER